MHTASSCTRPDEIVEAKEFREKLLEELPNILTTNELLVMKMSLGLDYMQEEKSYEFIADILHRFNRTEYRLSVDEVEHIKFGALAKIRERSKIIQELEEYR